ncbi:MAG: ABC transporter ATP-binding protein [Dermatophilaceae bacterium]|nr:ABC transporter ATP-binding protein [Dermatophilaceae bacterium]NUQ32772.1 ABC transporter ATP-binding protein [Dermatophilaceae bacterium]
MASTFPAYAASDAPPVVGLAVDLQGVTRVFDGVPAIASITLAIPVGEVVLLRGHNGSGKSTLLRVIATALSPTYGAGCVLGLDLQRDRAGIRAHTDLLGHQTRLYADLTAVENLRFTCGIHGLPTARVGECLERVGLGEVGGVRVASFSQGMRQRLALARCLLRSPAVVLLDEPYAGLDADARHIVDDLLAGARLRGTTVLLASHEPPPAGLVSATAHLENGRLVGMTRGLS